MIAQAGEPSQPEWIPWDPGLRKRDQAGASGAGLVNQPNPFLDRSIEVEEGGGYLYRCNFQLGMSDGHCILLYAAGRRSHANAQVTCLASLRNTPGLVAQSADPASAIKLGLPDHSRTRLNISAFPASLEG
jgi:hypothetical protein